MLPPDDHARAFSQLLAELRDGRLDPEMRSGNCSVPLSMYVRVTKTRQGLGPIDAVETLAPVLAHYGIAERDWVAAEGAWRAFGYVLEISVRTTYWTEVLDVELDVAAIRNQLAYR